MANEPEKLADAEQTEVVFSLSHALQFDGKKHYHRADGLMAKIVAEHIYDFLQKSGFVIKKKPPVGDSAPRGGQHRPPMKD